jgi:hypothetical protein
MQDKEVPERKDKKQEKRTTGQRMGMGVEAPMPQVDAAPTAADAVTQKWSKGTSGRVEENLADEIDTKVDLLAQRMVVGGPVEELRQEVTTVIQLVMKGTVEGDEGDDLGTMVELVVARAVELAADAGKEARWRRWLVEVVDGWLEQWESASGGVMPLTAEGEGSSQMGVMPSVLAASGGVMPLTAEGEGSSQMGVMPSVLTAPQGVMPTGPEWPAQFEPPSPFSPEATWLQCGLRTEYFRDACQKLGVWPKATVFVRGYAEQHVEEGWNCSWDVDVVGVLWVTVPWSQMARLLAKVENDHAHVMLMVPQWWDRTWRRRLEDLVVRSVEFAVGSLMLERGDGVPVMNRQPMAVLYACGRGSARAMVQEVRETQRVLVCGVEMEPIQGTAVAQQHGGQHCAESSQEAATESSEQVVRKNKSEKRHERRKRQRETSQWNGVWAPPRRSARL